MTKESASPPPTVEGQIASLDELSDIVEAFPDGIVHAFGYGSGVFSQSSSSAGRLCSAGVLPMMDLIFAVDDPLTWHRENMERYPEHYASLIRWTGPRMAHAIQTNGGASVYFNPYVDAPTTCTSKPQRWCMGPIPQRQIKYGVVSTTDLINDLSSWQYLYLAGRLHKPTVLIGQGHPEILHHQQGNLMGALAASLLLVPGDNNNNNNNSVVESLPNIFCRIAGLSYSGDFRMAVGAEDPEKIHKLVHSTGKYPLWKNLYQNAFHKLSQEGLIHIMDDAAHGDGTVEWDAHDPQTRNTLASYLPSGGGICHSLEDIANPACGSVLLAKELSKIVAPAARGQGLKGIVTAGVGKSLQYAAAKFAKGALKR